MTIGALNHAPPGIGSSPISAGNVASCIRRLRTSPEKVSVIRSSLPPSLRAVENSKISRIMTSSEMTSPLMPVATNCRPITGKPCGMKNAKKIIAAKTPRYSGTL